MAEGKTWDFTDLVDCAASETPMTYSQDNMNGVTEKKKNFAMIPRTVQGIKGINATDIALLTAIALYSNSVTMECYASRATLMRTAHIGRTNTFANSIKRLRNAGVLIVDHRSRREEDGRYYTNRYRIIWPEGSFE